MRPLACVIVAGLFASLAVAAPPPTLASASPGSLSVGIPTVVDPVRGAGEPWIGVDNDGNPYVTGPAGSSTQTSWYWHSRDGGQTYSLLGPSGGHWLCPSGGGDSEVLIDHVNRDVYLVDQQALASLAMGKLAGGGTALASKCFAPPGITADRPFEALVHPTGLIKAPQFVEDGGKPIVYLSWACNGCDPPNGGLAYGWSDDGINWHAADPGVASDTLVTDQFGEAGTIHNYQWHGSMVADQETGYVFTALVCNSSCPDASGKKEFGVVVGKPGPTRTDITNVGQFASLTYQTVTSTVNGAPLPEPGALFPVLALDSAGTMYMAWVQGNATGNADATPPATSWHVYYSYSKDRPNHAVWSAPTRVDQGPASASTVFPALVAGDAGKLGFLWLGSDRREHPSHQDASVTWYPFMSAVTGADSAAPVFDQVRVGRSPSHLGDVCVQGTLCGATSPPGNRNMADFISIDLGPDGALQATWADDANHAVTNPSSLVPGVPVTMTARQTGGPRLVGTGTVSETRFATQTLGDGSGVVDSLGDSVTDTTDVAQLDLKGLRLATAGSNIVMHVSATSLASLTSPDPTGQSTVWWLVAWKFADHIYFAKAASTAGGPPTFTAGSPMSYDRPGLTYYTVPTLLDYRGGTTITGTRVGDEFVLNVPASLVGSPKTGDVLQSVTAYAMLDNGRPPVVTAGPGNVPTVADATPAFNALLGPIVSGPLGGGAGVGAGGRVRTPATGGRQVFGVVAVAALVCAAAARRFSRRSRRRAAPARHA